MATAVLQLTLYHPVGLKHFFLSVFAPGMLLNVLSSLPLLPVFSVKRGHRAAMLEKLLLSLFYCTALNL